MIQLSKDSYFCYLYKNPLLNEFKRLFQANNFNYDQIIIYLLLLLLIITTLFLVYHVNKFQYQAQIFLKFFQLNQFSCTNQKQDWIEVLNQMAGVRNNGHQRPKNVYNVLQILKEVHLLKFNVGIQTHYFVF
ncbi:unnamed protein product [Paramecium octaurelia]|uniref:Transmembrane protein n=1 Tax=Paramecium octaurelia TaxID=43137 RepID=A0A8S1X009_PAROT|nr:unnamed protein product [Paramecium octaurelia]